MRKSRFTTEQIIGFIKQAEVGLAIVACMRRLLTILNAMLRDSAHWRSGVHEQARKQTQLLRSEKGLYFAVLSASLRQ